MKLSVLKFSNLVETVDLALLDRSTGRVASFYLGRSSECHILLDDPKISREHAVIKRDGESWIVSKLAEESVVLVNGAPIREQLLATGDTITILPFTLTVALPVFKPPASPLEEIIQEETQTVMSAKEQIEQPLILKDPEVVASLPKELEAQKENFETHEVIQESSFVSENDENNQVENEKVEDEFASSPNISFENSETDQSPQQSFQSSDSLESTGDQFSLSVQGESSDGDGGDSTRVMQSFAQLELEIFGEHAPYDRFLLDQKDTYIGRDQDKCQIVLEDPEVSGVHAVIRKENIVCILEDLKSSNGTILNGVRINKSEITNSDEFIIGSTTFTLKIKSDFIKEEANALMPTPDQEVIEVEEVVEVHETVGGDATEPNYSTNFSSSTATTGKQSLLAKFKALPPARRMIIIVIILALILFLFDSDDTSKKKKATDTKKSHSLATKTAPVVEVSKSAVKLTAEQQEFVEASYQLAKELFDQGKYAETLFELQKIFSITPEYKNAKQLAELSKEGMAKLEELEKKRAAEEDKQIKKKKLGELLEKAKEAVKEKKRELAEALFQKITEIDPENFEIAQLKLELESWVREQERVSAEQASKESARNAKVEQLRPSKELYNKEAWYQAVAKLEEFLQIPNMDEDLTKEAIEMSKDSKAKLKDLLEPLLSKARSFKEGQDLKGAYDTYKEVLIYDPASTEALNEVAEIKETLNNRARKIYREAIISESLSLFDDAKEKLKEVQQISPTDSEYYRKASDKLKEYLDQ